MTQQTQAMQANHIGSIVTQIKPSVAELLKSHPTQNHETLVSSACKANIRASVDQLTQSSEFLESMVATHKLAILGAEYDLATGRVHFFENCRQSEIL